MGTFVHGGNRLHSSWQPRFVNPHLHVWLPVAVTLQL